MVEVKPPNEKPEGISVVRVILLLVAVLGVAFLLFKHDPYTSQVLVKDHNLKKTSHNKEAPPPQHDDSSSRSNQEPASRTFTLQLSGLADGKSGSIVIQTHPGKVELAAAIFSF